MDDKIPTAEIMKSNIPSQSHLNYRCVL